MIKIDCRVTKLEYADEKEKRLFMSKPSFADKGGLMFCRTFYAADSCIIELNGKIYFEKTATMW